MRKGDQATTQESAFWEFHKHGIKRDISFRWEKKNRIRTITSGKQTTNSHQFRRKRFYSRVNKQEGRKMSKRCLFGVGNSYCLASMLLGPWKTKQIKTLSTLKELQASSWERVL